MGINWIAAAWGLAEATLFFFVPDIWLSIAGRTKLRVGLTACLYSLGGALVGGSVLYVWGHYDSTGALGVIEKVPAVSVSMIGRVRGELANHGVWSLFLGPIGGIPYKLYAAQAAATGIGLWLFLLISIPARLVRFILVTTIFHYTLRFFGCTDRKKLSLSLILIFWIVFYIFYFNAMVGP